MNKILKKGFTLVELLVVISILGILVTIVLNGLGTARNKAKDEALELEINQLVKAVRSYTILEDERLTSTAGMTYSPQLYATAETQEWRDLVLRLKPYYDIDRFVKISHPEIFTYGILRFINFHTSSPMIKMELGYKQGEDPIIIDKYYDDDFYCTWGNCVAYHTIILN